jgi:hypothetical protein
MTVTVKMLRPGALVHFTNNAQKFTDQSWKGRTEDDFRLSFALEAGIIICTQELCEVVSEPSAPVPADPRENDIKPCRIVPHLYASACNASVADIHQPSTIEVCSVENSILKTISAKRIFYDDTAVVDVSPFLQKGQKIQIRQWACSDKAILSDVMTVEAAPSLPTLIPATPVFDGEKLVEIWNTIAGAKVDLLANQNKD